MVVTLRTRRRAAGDVSYKYHGDAGQQRSPTQYTSSYQWLWRCCRGVPASRSRRWHSSPWRSGWRPPAPASAVVSSRTRAWTRIRTARVGISILRSVVRRSGPVLRRRCPLRRRYRRRRRCRHRQPHLLQLRRRLRHRRREAIAPRFVAIIRHPSRGRSTHHRFRCCPRHCHRLRRRRSPLLLRRLRDALSFRLVISLIGVLHGTGSARPKVAQAKVVLPNG